MNPDKNLAQRSYFTEFDALRFFAAILTAFYHADIVKMFYHTPDRPDTRNWGHLGVNAVTFFFVLSGFLITLLLLREKEKRGVVDIRAFYLRRVYRIWPLYYLILLSGLFILPYLPFMHYPKDVMASLSSYTLTDYVLLISFFPNVAKAGLIQDFWLISFCWSIGMEEQFYAVWPHLFRNIKRLWIPVLGIIIFFFLLRYGYLRLYPNLTLNGIITYFRFDNMALGGLVAIYFVKCQAHPTILLFRQKWALYILLVLALFYTFLAVPLISPLAPYIYGSMLLAVALHPGAIPILNNKFLRYLGQISYGIYMLNVLVSFVAINILIHFSSPKLEIFRDNFWLANISYYTIVLGGTLLLAHLSYTYYEQPFLRLKDKYAQPKTTPRG